MILIQTRDVGDMLSSAHAKGKADNRKAPYTILSTLRFLACQNLPLCGNYLSNTGGESHFMQLLRLHMEDVPILNAWLQKAQGQFMSPVTQNELLQIMAMTVLQKIAAIIAGKQFSIMVDETTDVSNTEQPVLCICYVNENHP